MKIYEIDDIAMGIRDIHSGVDDDLVVKSLEQYEEEIRKQERLKLIAEMKAWANRFNSKIVYVGDAMVGYDTKQARIINELKQKHEMKDDIDFFVEQERQKVIAELEEWVDKQPKATYWLNYNESEKHLSAESLKQKLNEMKGYK